MPSGDEEYDPWHLPLLCIFGSSVAILWIYSYSKWKNLISSVVSTRLYTDRPQERAGKIKAGLEPHVTIQICTYNEGDVVKATIDHACMVHWPKNKLTFHILDDSTDPHSINVISDRVAHWRECGMDIRRCTRSNRVGYKAGSLRYHFEAIESDFVAHFDADHRMEPYFLERAMPHFFDKKGNELPDVGLVQAPWGYYNIHQNLLTATDAIGLDVHHVMEQTGRAYAYGVFGFNGTGGIWRKTAIKDAGGWTWESITEDLALSYQAFKAGYRFVYVRDIPQMLELPGNFLAHIQQKHRWTKGFLQVFRYSYWGIFTCPKISPAAKFEAFCHITGPFTYPATLVLFLVYPYLMLHGIDGLVVRAALLLIIIESALNGIITCYAKAPGRNRKFLDTIWGRTARVFLVLPHLGLKLAMSLFETKAIIEGLFSSDATFLTTPKEGSSNAVKRSSLDDFVAWGGIGIAVHRMIFLITLDAYVESSFYSRFFILMNLFLCAALFWVSGGFLFEKHKRSRPLKKGRLTSRLGSMTLFVFASMLSLWFLLYGGKASRAVGRVVVKHRPRLLNVPFYVYEQLIWTNGTLNGMNIDEEMTRPSRYARHDDDYWFLKAALNHPMRTQDPTKAKLFVVPTLLNQVAECHFERTRTEYRQPKTYKICWQGMCDYELVHYTEEVLAKSPWFQRSEGKDHIVVASHFGWVNWTIAPETQFKNIAQCNEISFESNKYNLANRFSFPNTYIGKACSPNLMKTHDFAMVARLGSSNADLNNGYQNRRDICEWLDSNETRYNVSVCGQGDQCPALSNSRFGFHARGDTIGASRLMDTILSGTVPLFTLHEQYDILPDWYDWDKISYFADVSNKSSFLSSIDTILSGPSGYEQMLRSLLENRDLFDWHLDVPFDTYMYMLQCKLWPETCSRNVRSPYSALILP